MKNRILSKTLNIFILTLFVFGSPAFAWKPSADETSSLANFYAYGFGVSKESAERMVKRSIESDPLFEKGVQYLMDRNSYGKIEVGKEKKKRAALSPKFRKALEYLYRSSYSGNDLSSYMGLYVLSFSIEQAYPNAHAAKSAKVYRDIFRRFYPRFINTLIDKKRCVGYLYGMRYLIDYENDFKKAFSMYKAGKEACSSKSIPKPIRKNFFIVGEKVKYYANKRGSAELKRDAR